MDFSAPAGAAEHSWLLAATAGQILPQSPVPLSCRGEAVFPRWARPARVAASVGIRSGSGEGDVLWKLLPAALPWRELAVAPEHTAAELPAREDHGSGIPCFSLLGSGLG